MFDFQRLWTGMVPGVLSGITLPTVLALPICCRSPSLIWICHRPCILEALTQRLSHGVLGYSRWKNDEFLAAISHWFLSRHNTQIDPESLVYGPSVIYMVSELIRQWSSAGDAVVIHAGLRRVLQAVEGNQRQVCAVGLEKRTDGWFCDMVALEKALSRPESKILLLCSPHNPTGKAGRAMNWKPWRSCVSATNVKVISDEIHMDMVWADQPHIPWSNVARDSWALFTSGFKSFNIPALTGAYGIIEDEQSRNDYLSALKGRDGLSSPAVLALSATYRNLPTGR
jgi:cystathionine beta-lyase